MATKTLASVTKVSRDPFQTALVRHKKEMLALDAASLIFMNVDVPTAVTTVLGALPAMRGLRPVLVATLKDFDAKAFDGLESCALALSQAHGDYLSSVAPPSDLVSLNERAVELRDALLSDARALAERGFFSPERLAEFKGATGYRNVTFDLLGLSSLLLGQWHAIQGKTPTPRADLEEARTLSTKLLFELAARRRSTTDTEGVTDLRQRAYTLLYRAYEEARAAIAYVRRHEGDADAIAPSLYAGRGKRHRGKGGDVSTDPVPAPSAGGSSQPPTSPAAGAVSASPAGGATAHASPTATGSASSPPQLDAFHPPLGSSFSLKRRNSANRQQGLWQAENWPAAPGANARRRVPRRSGAAPSSWSVSTSSARKTASWLSSARGLAVGTKPLA